jgi:hypothetical protein
MFGSIGARSGPRDERRGGWTRSSRSRPDNNCVEVQFAVRSVRIRDSKQAAGPTLRFRRIGWGLFLTYLAADDTVPPHVRETCLTLLGEGR